MNYAVKFLISLVILVSLISCGLTPESDNSTTHIPYSRIAEDIEFWNERAESKYVSLQYFWVRTTTRDKAELYLLGESGKKRILANLYNGESEVVQMPVMSLAEAQSWTLVIDKPEWQVKITPNIKLELPAKKVSYRDLFVVLKDYDRRRDELDTLPRWLRQNYNRLFLSFNNNSDVFYENTYGHVNKHATSEDKTLTLHLNEKYYQENGFIIFSEIPTNIMPLN